MNKVIYAILIVTVFTGCSNNSGRSKRIPVAKAGNVVLYYDEIPYQVKESFAETDSLSVIRNYINKWAKKELLFQKAEENISEDLRSQIEAQLNETRINLLVYEYQRQMMLQKMDTLISEKELEDYYRGNESNFVLTSNIVKALFIKVPVETPNLYKIRSLSRSNNQKDFQELESLCYQFAEKFDDFNEKWVSMDRLSLELNNDISDQEAFLKRNTYYETRDSVSVYLVTLNDYRLRGALAPFEYVREDIKRIIWNNRRIEFIQALESGIYDEAIKDNGFKIY
jgi:hypothetical protein